MKRIRFFVAVLVLLSLLFTSCSPKHVGGEKKEDSKEKISIGITFDTFVLERWIRDRDVFVSAVSQENNAVVDVQNANGDAKKQQSQIKKFIEQKKDVIVIVAVDCFALTDVVEEAMHQGIKVVSYDRLIQGAATDLYITVDNTQVGMEMAKEVKEKLPEGGNIVMICGPEMDTNSEDVATAFEREMADSRYHILYKNHVKSWTPEYGFHAVTEAFRAAGEENVDAVMCGNDGLAGHVIRALSEKQLAGKVVVVGQDADTEACQRVVEGTQSMTVYKPIEELAKAAASCALTLGKGQDIKEAGYDIKEKELQNKAKVPYLGLVPTAVRKDNMDQVIIDIGFHLREEVYLNMQ